MFAGSYVALITPFHADGTINFEKLKQLCAWHIQNGTDGIVALGTTGESSTLSASEQQAVVRCVLDAVGGKIPVIVGAGSNCTEEALAKSLLFQSMGANALLHITPYYNKANQKGMYRHFITVADAVDIPILLYNVPGRTGCSLSYECVAQLAAHKNICGIKEASGNISFCAKVAGLINNNFQLLSGNDDMVVPVMSLGGTGVISVFANAFPRESHQMVAAWLAGDVERARQLQLRYLDIMNAMFIDVNPIPVKELMNLMGMEVGGYRLPLCEMEDTNREKLREALKKLEEV